VTGHAYSFDDDFSLAPAEFEDDTALPPFIELILVTLGYGPAYGLSAERAVREYAGQSPEVCQAIRALAGVVGTAGRRVRDAGLLTSRHDDNLRLYTPEELWSVNLATDVIAMLYSLVGLSANAKASITEALGDLDDTQRGHTWRRRLEEAGEGPVSFRTLRGTVPARTPRPVRRPGRISGTGMTMWP
jgi:hypothetical protein